MSQIIIQLIKGNDCWTEVIVDGKKAGDLEDADDTVEGTIENLIKMIPIENTRLEVIRRQ